MKSILFFIPSVSAGGAERVLVNLINNLPTGFDIYLKTLFKDNVFCIKRDVRYSYVFPFRFRGNVHLLKLFKPATLYKWFIGGMHYDVVISYLQSPTMRIIAGCTNGTSKLVNWIHNEFHHVEELSYIFRSRDEFFRCMERYDRTVHVAQTSLFALDKLIPQITPFSTVIYNTVESDLIKEKSIETEGVCFNASEINLISVGRFVPAKAFDRLVRIIARLREKSINAHLYLLGEGALANAYKKEAYCLGVSDYVTLLGYQNNPYKYVAKADLFVCSSRHEGYSTAITEALILGTPVITTECSGMFELLGENDYGIITSNDEDALYEAVFATLRGKGALAALKKKAQARSNFFSKDKTVNDVVKLFNELITDEK